MRIGVIGGGVVGRATARAFIEHVDEVKVYDILKERATCSLHDTLSSGLIFVCLPTPQIPNSLECYLRHIEDFFYGVSSSTWNEKSYVLRSTVPIGTTKRLSKQYNLPNLVHSPEFLTARCSITDAHIPSRNIIGVPNYGECKGSWYKLQDLYSTRFPGVPCYLMSSDESEAVKLFQNGFFATKIAYFNEVRTLADKLGLDWERVIGGVLSDGRIAHSHTQVPGPDGKRGFGGSCLPKDLSSLIYQLQENNLPALVTAATGLRNAQDRERR